MIALAPVDYAIIVVILMAIVLRIVGDVRDVLAAKSVKTIMKDTLRQKFSPRLTVIMPFESLVNIRPTLEHLQEGSIQITTVVVIDTTSHPKGANALRYFIRKSALKRVKVTARKAPDVRGIAGEYAKTGLVVVLPDTVRLHDLLYDDAIVLFGDRAVDSVRLIHSIRTNRTLHSGIEALFEAWRRYIALNGVRRVDATAVGTLPEGVMMRAKFARRLPRKPLRCISTRRPLYSIAAEPNLRGAWYRLLRSVGGAESSAIVVISAILVLLLRSSYDATFAVGIFAVLYVVFVWWSLGAAWVSLADRLSLLLLAPFFIPIAMSLIIVRMIRSGVHHVRVLRGPRVAPTA